MLHTIGQRPLSPPATASRSGSDTPAKHHGLHKTIKAAADRAANDTDSGDVNTTSMASALRDCLNDTPTDEGEELDDPDPVGSEGTPGLNLKREGVAVPDSTQDINNFSKNSDFSPSDINNFSKNYIVIRNIANPDEGLLLRTRQQQGDPNIAISNNGRWPTHAQPAYEEAGFESAEAYADAVNEQHWIEGILMENPSKKAKVLPFRGRLDS